jgi:hypothetical protein
MLLPRRSLCRLISLRSATPKVTKRIRLQYQLRGDRRSVLAAVKTDARARALE